MSCVHAFAILLALLFSTHATMIDHDKVQPFAQPNPVTISEKAAVKFKPQLHIERGCVSFPAVNAAGELTGGLKGTGGTGGCTKAPLGSQIYGRSAWYQDKWAMLFAWYFPKGFSSSDHSIRHYWSSMVLWLDNPALDAPTFLGASLSQQLHKPRKILFGLYTAERKEPYSKQTAIPPMGFVGTQATVVGRVSRWRYTYNYSGGSNVSTRISQTYTNKGDRLALTFAFQNGEFQDLIMWDQMTDAARAALNSADFGESKVPFSDQNFQTTLGLSWPF
ncbi:NPP1-like protein [Phytophthora infestans T30-4]|uniref:NPP1-like protein n=1 Tax=Phytophthora infestans (strain T30-4) TaxID=403677 RepID=D0NTT4_PHYIT|nr:NPP1-like protein [Phytophthora infestans T30-4]EEY65046.1 NPP1-like protein [Phytophthora infestans T30-4]|eukprot:XP_002897534.1 NPP1-like protein [Phytophthora infestans T30-4]